MSNLSEALEFLSKGFSIIPVGKDKKPLIKWIEFQSRYATEEEVQQWFKQWPDANIGIVTGRLSGMDAVDCDSQEGIETFEQYLPDNFETPIVSTPNNGRHYWFKHEEGIRNNARILKDIDTRGEGGYVIAPPSTNGGGRAYAWISSYKEVALDSLPNAYKKILLDSFSFSLYRESQPNQTLSHNESSQVTTSHKYFIKGRRDNDLFTVANCMTRAKVDKDMIQQVLEILGQNCEPPFDQREIPIKIKSALERVERKENSVMQEIKKWLESQNGHFRVTDYYNESHVVTKQEKHAVIVNMKRLCDQRVLEKYGNRSGEYRKVDTDIEFMDFVNVSKQGAIDLELPLNIHKKTIFFPKNVIIIAGVTGYGKTSFILNTMRKNMEKFEWIYFMSEMSDLALNYKLSCFHWPIEAWKMKVVPDYVWDHNSIQDKIFPNAINVIDYLEPEGDKPYGIHEIVTKIIKKLDKGMAIIAVQKKPNADLGTGGVYSAKAASLYLSLDWGTINIFKNRFREEDKQPLRTRRDFEIQPGQHFVAKGSWYDPNEFKRTKKLAQVVDDEGGFIKE